MIKYLKKLPREVQDLIRLISNLADRSNIPAYLVGGFVRDLILGAANFDLDIVVEGSGISFAEDLAKALKAKLIGHRRFGTATVFAKGRLKIDIATARKEFYPQPAHLPEVTSGSLKDDLFRRDFTINAMAICINARNSGKLIDFFGGNSDLRNKKVRVLHPLSFIDDPTRILRAVRFEKRYNFTLEPRTLQNLKEALALGMLEKVHPHRVRDELMLLLKEAQPLESIKRIKQLAGFNFIDKNLRVCADTFRFLGEIRKQINWFNRNFPARRKLDTWLMYFTGLIDSLSASAVGLVCGRFALRGGEQMRILNYKRIKPAFIQKVCSKNIRPSGLFALFEPLSYEVILLLGAKYRNKKFQKAIENFLEIYNGMSVCVCGHDLRGLGLKPGPYYQKIFAKVLKAKLDGRVKNKEEELCLIKDLIKATRS